MKKDLQELVLLKIKEGYLTVSTNGDIFGKRKQLGSPNPDGYLTITIYMGNYKTRTVRAHQIVWLHQKGFIPEGMEINHIDGNKQNNSITNLELVDHRSNMMHALETGLHNPPKIRLGESNPSSKMTKDKVIELRSIASGLSLGKLSDMFGISKQSVHDILKGKTWKHV